MEGWVAEDEVNLGLVLRALGFVEVDAPDRRGDDGHEGGKEWRKVVEEEEKVEGDGLKQGDGEVRSEGGAGAKVLNVYQLGSRVYRTNEPGSDWDFLTVLTDDYNGTNLIDRGQFNSCFYTESNFRSMLLDHHFIALYCAFLPREHVWLESRPARRMLEEMGWRVEADKLKRAFFSKGCSSMNRAKVLCRKAQRSKDDTVDEDKQIHAAAEGGETREQLLRKSKKMLIHSLRYLHFGLQLLEHERITDYLVANSYWHKVKDMSSFEWSDYEHEFRPIYLELLARYPSDPVQPIEASKEVPPLFRKLFCYLHAPEQRDAGQTALEREILGVVVEAEKQRMALDKQRKGEAKGEASTTTPQVGTPDDSGMEMDTDETFRHYFPDQYETYVSMKARFERLCEDVQSVYDRIVKEIDRERECERERRDKNMNAGKEHEGKEEANDRNWEEEWEKRVFASKVRSEEYRGLLFAMRKASCSAMEHFVEGPLKTATYWLGERN